MEALSMPASYAPAAAPAVPWRRRLLHTLLYGRNVDRSAKAQRPRRSRHPRLRRWSMRSLPRGWSCSPRFRTAISRAAAASGDAVATARPDILDRNGLILATDVRAPSLFAEPRNIIDVDEATELLTAVLPDLDATELRERLELAPRLRLAQARDHAEAAARNPPARPAGVGFLSENKRVYPNSAEVSHLIGHVNIDNQGIAGIEKWVDGRGLQALHLRRPRHRPAAAADLSSRSICGCSTRCATS